MIRFDMPERIRFEQNPALAEVPLINIGNQDRFFVRFDGAHRTWYTKPSLANIGINLPMEDSATYPARELKTVESKSNGFGIHKLLSPKKYIMLKK